MGTKATRAGGDGRADWLAGVVAAIREDNPYELDGHSKAEEVRRALADVVGAFATAYDFSTPRPGARATVRENWRARARGRWIPAASVYGEGHMDEAGTVRVEGDLVLVVALDGRQDKEYRVVLTDAQGRLVRMGLVDDLEEAKALGVRLARAVLAARRAKIRTARVRRVA